GGHDVMGANQPADTFYFAEGTVRPQYMPYFCVQNPGERNSNVRITYMRGDGQVDVREITVPAHSRKTVFVRDTISTLMQEYCGLEQYFSELLHYQVMGLDMVLEAKNQDPVHYGPADQYLTGSFAPMISEELDCFRDNVERLVVSQATLVNKPNGSVIQLPPDGEEVLQRAQFVCEVVSKNALNVDKQTIWGTVIATQDEVPAGASLALTAQDKDSGQKIAATGVKVVPAAELTMGLPTNATSWYGPEGKRINYDLWDTSGETVQSSNNLSIVRYEFDGVTTGKTYDIIRNDTGAVLETVPVNKYDDYYNISDSGDNIFGAFALTSRGDQGSDRFLDGSHWDGVVINPGGGHTGMGDNWNHSTLSPKHASCWCLETPGAGTEHDTWEGQIRRAFTFGGNTGTDATVNLDYDVTDLQSFVDQYSRDGLQITWSAAGEFVTARYNFFLYDVTASAIAAQGPTCTFEVKGSAGTKKTVVSDDSNQRGSNFSVKLTNGHNYRLICDVYIEGKVTGPGHAYGSMDVKLSNGYLSF
ncbi:MAG: hypothetical protein JW738_06150, partial [Actinobacteria bacterium]|nr:hypothetical protein [Actinomycetota bacterium]